QRQHIPVWLSLILVLLVVAPLVGIAVERFVARGLGAAPVGVSLVVTVGLLVGLIGLAQQIWPAQARNLPQFFNGHSLSLGSVQITWHELLTIVLSGVVAGALYLLLTQTRVGTAMRASVDNAELLRLYGGRPQFVAALAWAVGMSLAALAGILLTPVIGLQYYDLTLLVISAYAAAMLGRLRSLPLTYAGAMILGLLQSYAVGYLPGTGDLSGLRAVMPTLFLFAVIVLVPQAPLRIGQVKGLLAAPVPSARKAGAWGAGLVLVSMLFIVFLSDASLLNLGTAVTYGIVMLSLVLLTGYGGHVSLAQITFAGVGALAYCKLDEPNLVGIVLATLIAAGVGAVVALPVLRLTGLYLALATLAFAELMDKLIFAASWAFQTGGTLSAKRLSILGWQVSDLGTYVLLMMVVFVLVGLAVLMLRRGPLGRVLIATRDSQAACGTLGLDLRWFRVGLFAASAGIAGLGGALFAGLRGTVGAQDFQFFNSLTLLLAAVVFGVTSVTGAMLGGLFLMYLPVAQSEHPGIAGLLFAVLGFGAVALGRDPNGLANRLFGLRPWLEGTVYPQLARRFPGMALDKRDNGVGSPEDLVGDAEEVSEHVPTTG
ncbi:MAG TPA: ABC transporter permease, partial [Marmoricola sp.]